MPLRSTIILITGVIALAITGCGNGSTDSDFTLPLDEGSNLTIRSFRTDPFSVTQRQSFDMIALVDNRGDEAAGPFRVQFLLSGPDGRSAALTGFASGAPAGGVVEVTVTGISLSEAGTYSLVITADVDGQVDETSELDNRYTTTFLSAPTLTPLNPTLPVGDT